VRVARDTAEPPLLAYLTHFPRMSVVLGGCHVMHVASGGQPAVIRPVAGSVVYVPANCWNLPDWSEPVRDLTFLFGTQHVGVSLIDHPGGGPDAAPQITKTSVPRQPGAALQHLLDALSAAVAAGGGDEAEADGGLVRSITAAVLHAGLSLLTEPAARGTHKARRLYESIRLYVQENAHLPISRESVAADFGLTPNHISRLFRQEGELGFNETLNQARVERAKFMLGQYGTSLKQVARHCGFATTAYFCRTFKKVTARTPTEYRLSSSSAGAVAASAVTTP
jgi:AraC-like DNA-binding protein